MSDSEDSNCTTTDEETGCWSCYRKQASYVPHRMEQVLISWIFIVASATLLLDFGALQALVREKPGHFEAFAELCNWFGVISCYSWFIGFVFLAHWLGCVGAGPISKAGCYFKLVAAFFFNLQPATGTMNDPLLGGPAGLWWTNVTGIVLFHIGNCLSCFDFWLYCTPGGDKKQGWFFYGNLPITGMWCYQMATWALVAGNVLACTPPGGESIMFVGHPLVFTLQMVGGSLLLIGVIGLLRLVRWLLELQLLDRLLRDVGLAAWADGPPLEAPCLQGKEGPMCRVGQCWPRAFAEPLRQPSTLQLCRSAESHAMSRAEGDSGGFMKNCATDGWQWPSNG
eukprot:CAMPEP_0206585000 /NCGR_PEP_ID=MMETSP0325_2-20121206/36131_1 /ASSEMBLY_ACC=CAM_ASM_000347 /TAXON_ID=2866 /ORGANISM="Crypthecodinium cohnii, Strain Seligo" /LENGTH=338 /DNA_ID=CAMNT_0054092413 /DNA_START=43 /DNA_END=1056 /DNA_ORIENTATION=-